MDWQTAGGMDRQLDQQTNGETDGWWGMDGWMERHNSLLGFKQDNMLNNLG